ncbi:hypothetical protein [Paracoccus contaminans]|uniref:DUF2238 domain-containing protein n=1 Tax=Paracoccus contaminans TaxID=1945662 RepID=A0A1W6CZ17_9RHOB|nr:hypothetical protein [Paracoccus contaminans]ARJ70075.1 hypothetical protein B0A89_10965 [Paracoccus contaminans]
MIALIRAMFATPEAQADPYVWAAALMGHWAIGAGLTALIMAIWIIREAWNAVAVLSMAYLVGWEGGQLITAAGPQRRLSWALVWDGILDWSAVTLGAITAAALWHRRRRLIAAAVAATAVILTAGVGRRK